MADPVFVRILERISLQLQLISIEGGYNTDIGQYAQLLLGHGVVDIDSQPAGSIVVEPGRELSFDADGAQRQGVVPLEQRPSRDITVSVAQTTTNREHWLKDTEKVAADVRRAIFSYGQDWRVLSVVRLEQSNQDSGWPRPGSSTLIVQLTFRVTYIER